MTPTAPILRINAVLYTKHIQAHRIQVFVLSDTPIEHPHPNTMSLHRLRDGVQWSIVGVERHAIPTTPAPTQSLSLLLDIDISKASAFPGADDIVELVPTNKK